MDARSIPKSPRRSLLFTPGDSIRKIKKAAQVGADIVILDLEDAVAINQKEEARGNVVSALSDITFEGMERLVRVNSPDSDFFADDLEAIAGTGVDGIVIPKVETAGQLQRLDPYLTGSAIRLFVLIETALGVMNIKEIAQSSERLEALLFGAEDLAADLGATRTQAGMEIFYGRSAVVTASAAYGLEAIDTVYLDFNDLAGLKEDARLGQQMGYSGKMAIHPGQIKVINRVFSPTADEIMGAQRLIEAYEVHVAAGSGVFTLDGQMVDKPVVRAAERLLERAKLSGLLNE